MPLSATRELATSSPLALGADVRTRRRLVAAELDRVADQVLEDEPRAASRSPSTVGQRPSTSTSAPRLLDRERRGCASARRPAQLVEVDDARAALAARPTRENASRSLISACMRLAPSTAKSMYWSAALVELPRVAPLRAAGRSSRPCAAAPGGRARRRRRTARARRWSARAPRPSPGSSASAAPDAPRARRRSAARIDVDVAAERASMSLGPLRLDLALRARRAAIGARLRARRPIGTAMTCRPSTAMATSASAQQDRGEHERARQRRSPRSRGPPAASARSARRSRLQASERRAHGVEARLAGADRRVLDARRRRAGRSRSIVGCA